MISNNMVMAVARVNTSQQTNPVLVLSVIAVAVGVFSHIATAFLRQGFG